MLTKLFTSKATYPNNIVIPPVALRHPAYYTCRSAQQPVSFGMVGSVGVCGLLTNGQTYPKTFGGISLAYQRATSKLLFCGELEL